LGVVKLSIESVGVRSGRQRNNTGVASGPIVLGPSDSLKGTLRTENGVTIHGDVEGEIFAAGDVVVEASSTVVATVEGRNVDIRGQVKGNVKSSKRLSLSGSGTLQGDATAARLIVEDGATLNGSITMGGGKDIDTSDESRMTEFDATAEANNGDLVAAGDHESSA
jgi:cytoskeletal protein CcmA (bactofilin family)